MLYSRAKVRPRSRARRITVYYTCSAVRAATSRLFSSGAALLALSPFVSSCCVRRGARCNMSSRCLARLASLPRCLARIGSPRCLARIVSLASSRLVASGDVGAAGPRPARRARQHMRSPLVTCRSSCVRNKLLEPQCVLRRWSCACKGHDAGKPAAVTGGGSNRLTHISKMRACA